MPERLSLDEFSGGIYRWAYFGFFQVEVMTLNLPVESFYFAAFQSLFGNPLIFLRTTITFIITTLLIIVILQIFQKLQRFFVRYLGIIQLN